jgi:hypothetical protein
MMMSRRRIRQVLLPVLCQRVHDNKLCGRDASRGENTLEHGNKAEREQVTTQQLRGQLPKALQLSNIIEDAVRVWSRDEHVIVPVVIRPRELSECRV